MEKKRKRLIKLFNSFTLRYKDSIRYVKLEKSKTKRVFYGVRKFGLSYILYNMARLRTPGLFWSIKTKLFLGRKMVWPASDVGANVFSMYGILQDKTERKLALWMIKNFGNRTAEETWESNSSKTLPKEICIKGQAKTSP